MSGVKKKPSEKKRKSTHEPNPTREQKRGEIYPSRGVSVEEAWWGVKGARRIDGRAISTASSGVEGNRGLGYRDTKRVAANLEPVQKEARCRGATRAMKREARQEEPSSKGG